mmetsp:Transcript_36915/g.35639  ORF Transcript_36915/g.35639 Transcript_36915/m.35639 type:complete len:106 (-) Transcript_36915:883-1200(-)
MIHLFLIILKVPLQLLCRVRQVVRSPNKVQIAIRSLLLHNLLILGCLTRAFRELLFFLLDLTRCHDFSILETLLAVVGLVEQGQVLLTGGHGGHGVGVDALNMHH